MSASIAVQRTPSAPVHAPARAPASAAARPLAGRAVSPPAVTHPQEDELGRHLQQCKAQQTLAFRMAGWLERIHGVLAPRFITTATTASALMLIALMWM
jgi:hypothetical protein